MRNDEGVEELLNWATTIIVEEESSLGGIFINILKLVKLKIF
jgi:hypothetical protein